MPDNVKEARAWIDAWRNKQVYTCCACQSLAVVSRKGRPLAGPLPLLICVLLVPLAVPLGAWASQLLILLCDRGRAGCLCPRQLKCMPYPSHLQGGGSRDPSLPSWFPGAKLPGYLDGTLPAVSSAAFPVLRVRGI